MIQIMSGTSDFQKLINKSMLFDGRIYSHISFGHGLFALPRPDQDKLSGNVN